MHCSCPTTASCSTRQEHGAKIASALFPRCYPKSRFQWHTSDIPHVLECQLKNPRVIWRQIAATEVMTVEFFDDDLIGDEFLGTFSFDIGAGAAQAAARLPQRRVAPGVPAREGARLACVPSRLRSATALVITGTWVLKPKLGLCPGLTIHQIHVAAHVSYKPHCAGGQSSILNGMRATPECNGVDAPDVAARSWVVPAPTAD